MSDGSSIEWTDATWQVTRGCSQVSPGCTNCYAQSFAHRGLHAVTRGLTRLTASGPRWTGEIRLAHENLAHPLTWKRGRRIFVNSMSDLFHEDVPNEYIAAVFGVMAAAPQHTFQVLTKRAERMAQWFDWAHDFGALRSDTLHRMQHHAIRYRPGLPIDEHGDVHANGVDWPLPNVWLGVSVENQEQADARIPHLLRTPAAVRFLSCEPLLERVLLDNGDSSWLACTETHDDPDAEPCCASFAEGGGHFHGVDWVIVGGESGPGARAYDLAWPRSIIAQCHAAGVRVFHKQLGSAPETFRAPSGAPDDGGEPVPMKLRDRKGGDMAEWPEDLRVREMPAVRR